MAKQAPKAKTMKILDEATMTYKTVHLYNVKFGMTNGDDYVVQIYSPSETEVSQIAHRLYGNKGKFLDVIEFWPAK
jgi:hypothetical protein